MTPANTSIGRSIAELPGAIILTFLLLTYLCLTAPEGWQDEQGFHFGRRPESDDQFHALGDN